MPNFDGNPAGALSAFTEETKGILVKQGEQIAAIDSNVMEFSERIEAVEKRAAKLPTSEDLDKKFEELKRGEKFAEVADRLKKLEASGARLEQFAGGKATNDSPRGAFEATVGEWKELAAFREMSRPEQREALREGLRLKVPRLSPRTGGKFASSTVLDDSYLGDASIDVTRPGVIELLSDPVGLVDVVNTVPPINADTYRGVKETQKSSGAGIATKSTSAVAGDALAVAEIVLDSVLGFIAGRDIYIFTTAGRNGPHTIDTVDTANSKLTFATAVIDYAVAAGDDVTAEEYLATGEGLEKPGSLAEVEITTVDLQTLAAYVFVTRQRLLRTNQFNLAGWLNTLLPRRLRETLEYHLLYGTGSSNLLHGFLGSGVLPSGNTDTWSTSVSTGDNRVDLLLWSAAQIPGDVGTVAVLHKLDWNRITRAKDSNGNYTHSDGEGPRIIDTPGLKAIGSVRVVLSKKIAQTTGLVFAPEYASEVVPGGDAEMIIGYRGDQIIENKITMLYESSYANFITDDQAFRKLNFDGAPA